jgi:hypothetical protein
MSVRSAIRVWMLPALYVLAFVLALVLLVIIVVFGAIFALGYRNRRPGFSYFACSDDKPKADARSGAAPAPA